MGSPGFSGRNILIARPGCRPTRKGVTTKMDPLKFKAAVNEAAIGRAAPDRPNVMGADRG